ncbi:HIT family protein [Rhodococcus rhodnii]|uniref:Histidine triad (HIT) protein n=2 Tax=Rhodococcus rhodnii TaxID=38312 RepID=R7WI89_9NOCA|nr:HIT family protein [Rhodococcus rhodnii]EOM74891.1 histidine triad (HIT) protein [Rhodococcus rhodnii LMG 5362]TXG91662.1 HIT family protein [Rhodococcus rhodnii]
MTDCPFCAIVHSGAPATRVFEDERTVAFLDIRPLARGHTLVVPRAHASGLHELTGDDAAAVFATAQRLAAAMRSGPIAADGVHLVVNDGRAAMQTVFHAHMHVVPRHRGDKISLAAGIATRRRHDAEQAGADVRAGLPPE